MWGGLRGENLFGQVLNLAKNSKRYLRSKEPVHSVVNYYYILYIHKARKDKCIFKENFLLLNLTAEMFSRKESKEKRCQTLMTFFMCTKISLLMLHTGFQTGFLKLFFFFFFKSTTILSTCGNFLGTMCLWERNLSFWFPFSHPSVLLPKSFVFQSLTQCCSSGLRHQFSFGWAIPKKLRNSVWDWITWNFIKNEY